MSAERLAAIHARTEAASAGPWRVDGQPDEVKSIVGPLVARNGLVRMESLATDVEYDADAEFIAHARGDVPWLLQQIDQRDAVLNRITDAPTWNATQDVLDEYIAAKEAAER